MNQHNELTENACGNWCTPSCAPPCEHQASPAMDEHLGAPSTSACLCDPKVCSIFGVHDRHVPGPDPNACSPRKKRPPTNPNTLGSPVGVLQATITMKSTTSDIHAHRYATYLVAFMKIYTTPESEWTEKTLDCLIKEGQALLAKPDSPEYTVDSPLDIYSHMEGKVKRWHNIDGISFHVELSERFALSSATASEDATSLPDMTMDSFRLVMKKFFDKYRYGLLKVAGTYKLVWRSLGVYFVLDLYGRRPEDLVTDKEAGKVMLICLRALDNVCHLIANLSGIQPTDAFNLRELKIVKLIDRKGKTMTREFGKRVQEYHVINDDYAVLKSDYHLLRNSSDPLRTRSALPVGVAALLAAKIDHPATWNEKMIEQIICYGVNVCVCCWEQCLRAGQESIDIERFPNTLRMAQFNARYTLTPRKHVGTWKCVPNFKQSELEAALTASFEEGDNNLLVQIDQNIYALFKKNNFYYIFDPYRHRVEGLPTAVEAAEATGKGDVAGEGGGEKAVEASAAETASPTTIEVKKASTVRMFSSLDVLLKVFTQMLLETNRTTQFAVHSLKINAIELATSQKADGERQQAQTETIPPNEEFEIKSLNETICFEEDEAKCKLELGQEDEDEDDITSGIIQMDLAERSETEESAEELEEEEGVLENLGEYESSSSGDGQRHGHGRRKKSKERKHGDQDGGAGGRKGKKGGKGRGKKAKGDNEDKEKKGKKNKDRENKKKKKGKKDEGEDFEMDKRKKKKNKSDKERSEKEKAERDKKHKEKTDKDKSDKDKDKDKNRDKDNDKDKDKDKYKDKDKDKDKGKNKDNNTDKDKDKDKNHTTDHAQGKTTDATRRVPGEADDVLRRTGANGERDGHDGTKVGDDRREGDDLADLNNDDDDADSCGNKDHRHGDYPELICRPTSKPGYSCTAYDMAVVGSESGTCRSITRLLRAGFQCADRVLTMTPWGNYVAFRGQTPCQKIYFLYDGCTCNVDRFRHLELKCGTAGLLSFCHLNDVVCYILDSKRIRCNLKKSRKNLVDEICRQYC